MKEAEKPIDHSPQPPAETRNFHPIYQPTGLPKYCNGQRDLIDNVIKILQQDDEADAEQYEPTPEEIAEGIEELKQYEPTAGEIAAAAENTALFNRILRGAEEKWGPIPGLSEKSPNTSENGK